MLGLHCCVDFLAAGSGGCCLLVVHGLLLVVASPVAAQGPGRPGFGTCDLWAEESPSQLQSTSSVVVTRGLVPWRVGLPGPGIEPMFPALAGGFFITEPPGKAIDF